MLGAVLSSEEDLRRALNDRLHDFVAAFFLPIFFTYTGLRTNIGALATGQLWLICLVVLAAAIVGKFIGTGVAARLTGFSTRESGIIGVLMNTRALMELIVINLGKDLGVLPDSVFVMLVLMALVTTAMTSPIIFLLRHGTEFEPYLNQSPLAWWSRSSKESTQLDTSASNSATNLNRQGPDQAYSRLVS